MSNNKFRFYMVVCVGMAYFALALLATGAALDLPLLPRLLIFVGAAASAFSSWAARQCAKES